MGSAEIDVQVLERQVARRAANVGGQRQRARERCRHACPQRHRRQCLRVVGGELELALDAPLVARAGRYQVEPKPRRRLDGKGDLKRHVRRIDRAAVRLEAERRSARHELAGRGVRPGARLDRHRGVDVLEPLDRRSRAIGHGAVLDDQVIDGERPHHRLARCIGFARTRRSRPAGAELPVAVAGRHVFDIELGLDQRRAADLDATRQQRPKGQLHFDRAQPYHVFYGGARRIGQAHVAGRDRRSRQQGQAERSPELDGPPGQRGQFGGDRTLEAVKVDELRRQDEAGKNEGRQYGQGDGRFSQGRPPWRAAPGGWRPWRVTPRRRRPACADTIASP